MHNICSRLYCSAQKGFNGRAAATATAFCSVLVAIITATEPSAVFCGQVALLPREAHEGAAMVVCHDPLPLLQLKQVGGNSPANAKKQTGRLNS